MNDSLRPGMGAIVLSHGSKQAGKEDTTELLVAKVRRLLGSDRVKSAYLQFSEKDLAARVKEFVDAGIAWIAVIPLFVSDGVHVTRDIPEALGRIRVEHPEIRIWQTTHIGDDDLLAQLLVRRICDGVPEYL